MTTPPSPPTPPPYLPRAWRLRRMVQVAFHVPSPRRAGTGRPSAKATEALSPHPPPSPPPAAPPAARR